jgi:hypothetical protein
VHPYPSHFLSALFTFLPGVAAMGEWEECFGRWRQAVVGDRDSASPDVQSQWYKFNHRLIWQKGSFQPPTSTSGACLTSMWRPYEGRKVAHIFCYGPSGLVPKPKKKGICVVIGSSAVPKGPMPFFSYFLEGIFC